MAKQLSDLEFVRANEAARAIAEAAIVAYYMARAGNPGAFHQHAAHMRKSLDRLCEIMGLHVIDADDLHRHNDAAMLQSANAMIPEE